tara:strand:+ start:86 stop:2182 length:2097 start_codon:yes stop_codon:yes gene_type:complete
MALPNPNNSTEMNLKALIRQSEEEALLRKDALDVSKETLTIQKNIDKAQVYEGMKAGEDRKKRIQKPIQELTGTGNNKNISALNRKIKFGNTLLTGNIALTEEEQKQAHEHRKFIHNQEEEKAKTIGEFHSASMSKKGGILALEAIKTSLIKPFEVIAGSFNKAHSFITHDMDSGVSQVKKGWEKLTDGLGEFGPIINVIKTTLGKFRAALDVVVGSIRSIFDVFGKVGSFFKGTYQKFSGGANEKDSPETQAMKDVIAADDAQKAQVEAGNQTMLNHKELRHTIFAALVDFNGWKNDSGELLGDAFYQERMRGAHSGHTKEEWEAHDAEEEQGELEQENEKDLHDLQMKNEEKAHKKNMFHMMKFWVTQTLMGIVKFFMPLIALMGVLGFTIWKIKEDGTGLTGAMGVLQRGFSGLIRGIGWVLGKMPGMSGLAASLSTFGLKTPAQGAPIAGPVQPGAQPLGNAKPSMGQKLVHGVKGIALRNLLPGVGATIEGVWDSMDQDEKFEVITKAYKSQTPIIEMTDGSVIPMSDSQYNELKEAHAANKRGSKGRAIGSATAVAATGAALLLVPGIGWVTGAALLIGAGMMGGNVGDNIASGNDIFDGGVLGLHILKGHSEDSSQGLIDNWSGYLQEVDDFGNGQKLNDMNRDATWQDPGTNNPYSNVAIQDNSNTTSVDQYYNSNVDTKDRYSEYSLQD